MEKVEKVVDKITPKQWSVLLIELNMIKEQWKSYAKIEIQTPGLNKIIAWGKRRYDTREDKRSRKSVGKNKKS